MLPHYNPSFDCALGAFNDIAALKPSFLALSELEMLAALANISEAISSE
jgi:integral membrane sensor domain MASE1